MDSVSDNHQNLNQESIQNSNTSPPPCDTSPDQDTNFDSNGSNHKNNLHTQPFIDSSNTDSPRSTLQTTANSNETVLNTPAHGYSYLSSSNRLPNKSDRQNFDTDNSTKKRIPTSFGDDDDEDNENENDSEYDLDLKYKPIEPQPKPQFFGYPPFPAFLYPQLFSSPQFQALAYQLQSSPYGLLNSAQQQTEKKKKKKTKKSKNSLTSKKNSKKTTKKPNKKKVKTNRIKDEVKDDIKEESKEETKDESKARKRKKRLLKKAPNAPKRGKSAYICFSIAKRPEIQAELGPKVKATNVVVRIAAAWRELPEEQKKAWEEKANMDKRRYEHEIQEYDGPMKIPNKRIKKSPDAPKRGMSAFLLYSQVMRSQLKEIYPNLRNSEINRMLGEHWNQLPLDKKQPYIDKANYENQRYLDEMNQYKKERTPGRKSKESYEKFMDSTPNSDFFLPK